MTNAATALADLLVAWGPVDAHGTTESSRGIDADRRSRREFWHDQATAVGLAQSVDNILRGMEASGTRMEMFEASVVSWYEAVFSYTAPWTTSSSSERAIIESPRLENLQALGALLDQVGTVALSGEEIANLRTTLDEAKDLAARDETLPTETKRYIWTLIAQAVQALDDYDAFGTAPARSVLLELSGAAHLQGHRRRQQG